MGIYAKLPFAQAPGMGLNAFFAYTIILGMGYTFNQALAAVFISGAFFILITVMGLREKIVQAIPVNISRAITPGIGLFIALIGFVNSNLITKNPATMIQLIDFSRYGSTEIYDSAKNLSYGMAVNNALLCLIGLFITSALLIKKVKGSLLTGIILTTLIGIPMGITTINTGVFKFTMPTLAPTFFKMDFSGLLGLGSGNFLVIFISAITVIISCTLIDMFDTIGTLIGTGRKAGLLDKNEQLPQMKKALMADAVATTVGACLGTSTVTTYIESAAGIAEGGKTGLSSVVTGLLFLAAIFAAPLFGIVPAAATAPALIIVGVMMMASVTNIDFNELSEAIPAFLTIVLMPFTYSIATGIAAGIISWPLLKISKGQGGNVPAITYILALLFIVRFAFITH
jgi:AGZA family xanthine/uracil permease-like MFS transporter